MAKKVLITQEQLDEIVGSNSSYLDSLGTDFRKDGANAVYTGEKKDDSDSMPVTTDKVAQQLPKAPYFYRRDTRASYFESKKSDWKKNHLNETNDALKNVNINIDPTTQNKMVAGKDSAGANAAKNGNITYTNATTIKSRMDKLKDAVAKGDENALQTYNNMGGDVFYNKIKRELKNKTDIVKRNNDTMKQIGVKNNIRMYGNGKGHHGDSIITPWINESKSIKSQKLQDILNAHNGFYKHSWQRGRKINGDIRMTNADLNNLTDDQVIGVVDYSEIVPAIKMIRQNKEYGFVPGDDIDYVQLGDEKYVLLLVKNAHYYPERMGEKNSFPELFNKQQTRKANNPYKGKHNTNYKWKSQDAQHYVFNNPYYKDWDDEAKENMKRKIKDDYKK